MKSNDALPAITEKDFSRQVEELARLFGWRCYHSWISLRSHPGFPDLVLVRPPRVVLMELKSDQGKLTDSQYDWIRILKKCPGVEVYVARPSDWKKIEETLR